MAKFDPFRQQTPQSPQPGPPFPVPGSYPQASAPYPVAPAHGQLPPQPYPQPGYGQPAYGQPGYPQPQPVYGQPYGMPQQPAYPPQQPAYMPPPPTAPVAYGQPQYAPQNYPPNPYAPPPPAPVPIAYVPAPVPVPQPVMPAAPSLPMSAQANPMAPISVAPVSVTPVTVKPVAPKPVTPASVATQPRPVQPAALQPQAVPTTTRPAPAPVQPVKNVAAANRPVLAPVKPVDEKPKVEKDAPEDAPPKDPTEKVIKGAPPWMISMVVHMVLLIVLALIGIASIQKPVIEILSEPVYAETLGEQIIEQELQSPEFENMEIESPALSFDIKPADDPLAAPPILEMTSVDATDSVDTIEAPSIGLALDGRNPGSKKALLAAYGGNATTEASVEAGLQWLKKNQQQDGSWSLMGPFSGGAYVDNKVAATAMALLAFQGAGNTHKTGKHKDVVAKGWNALKKYQDPDGLFVCDSAHSHRLYAQAQATIAACELYGMTKDQEIQPIAQKALNYAIFAQAPEGGWRYQPKVDSDTSVTGWFVMALQSGMMAGLEVPSQNLTSIERFLDSVQSSGGSHYGYLPGRDATLAMTAEGLLCRMYLGWKHDDPRLAAGMDYVCGHTINYNEVNLYYWYYATQAAHHMGGHHWKQWNQVMIQTVPKAQLKTGAESGSWSVDGGTAHDMHGGRLYSTCLSIYMLESYYRHMPLYKHRIEMPKGTPEGVMKALDAASK